jgi:predicted ATPase
MIMAKPVLLKRVVLRNYKSYANCSVALGPLTFLVGPNGAGKSNFLDALRLVTESLNASLDHALRERGGINEVRRRSSGHPTHFGIRLEFSLPDGTDGWYAFRVGAMKRGGFEVQEEECHVYGSGITEDRFYKVEKGRVTGSHAQVLPVAASDRLYLVAASGLPEFRPLYDALSHMGFYNLNPEVIRDLQPPDTGEVLRRDGSNLASVLSLMTKEGENTRTRVVESLSKVVPGITDVTVKHVGKKETLEFRQRVGSNETPWRFLAENMSDGTLRALGVLTALFQSPNGGDRRVPLVGIEEPEAAVHPGAAGVLRDALIVASKTTQVLVTSHSPDLLDDKTVRDDWILGVASLNGETRIGPLDDAGRSVIRENLYTVGELLRQGQLTPDAAFIETTPARQLELFGDGIA